MEVKRHSNRARIVLSEKLDNNLFIILASSLTTDRAKALCCNHCIRMQNVRAFGHLFAIAMRKYVDIVNKKNRTFIIKQYFCTRTALN